MAGGQTVLGLARSLGRSGHRLIVAALAAVFGLAVLILIGAAAVVWRLSDGPVDVTALAQRLESVFAPDLSTGQVTLTIERAVGKRVLRLHVADALRHAGQDQAAQSVRSATIVLPLGRLLRADLAPEEVVADGVRLHVTLPAAGPGDTESGFDTSRLDALQGLEVTDLQVDVTDEALGQHWTVTNGSASLQRQTDGSLAGPASLTAAAGPITARLDAALHYGTAGATIQASLSPLSTTALAGAIPALAPLGAVDATVTLRAEAALGPALDLRHASVHAEAGTGTVQVPADHGGTSVAHFAALSLDAGGELAGGALQSATLQALRITLAPSSGNPPTTLVLSGTADRGGGQLRAKLAVDLDQVAFSDLGHVWPEGVGGGARSWLAQNVTAGTAHDGHFSFTLQGPRPADMAVTQASGTLAGDDATVWWLRPVPPIEHARAVLTWLDPDTMLITLGAGRSAGVIVKGGTMRITGLLAKDQVSVINADLAGPVKDVVTLLSNPRLKLLSAHPISFTNPAGAVAAHLTVNLPLDNKVTTDQIGIHATGTLSDLHLGAIAADRDLDKGQIAMDVTNDGLTATGTALLAHLPSTLQLSMDFRDGPPTQVLQHVAATARVLPADAKAAGLTVIGLDGGSIAVSLDYADQRNGTATLHFAADLKDAALDTPLGWSKTAGPAGQAEGTATLVHGRLTALDGIRAEAPGLSVQARSVLTGGRVALVKIDRGDIGRSSATGTIGLPQREGEPYRISLTGPRLDLEGRIGKPDPVGTGRATTTETGSPYALDLRFERVTFAPNKGLGPVAVTAAGDGRRLTSAMLTTGGADRTQAKLSPVPGGRLLQATSQDLGSLLRAMNLATEIDRGTMVLNATFDDRQAGSPLAGTLDLTDFTVRGAPLVGKVLQGLTLYGLVDAMSGPGLVFSRLTAPFRLQGGAVSLNEAGAYSSSLGVTASGSLDFGHQTMDLQGTIVPAYFFNSLPGRVPLLGRLFSPEKGSGVFAANFTLRGPVADPAVTVNPLAALAPGFTRRLFDLFN
jgi:hypothetical protein